MKSLACALIVLFAAACGDDGGNGTPEPTCTATGTTCATNDECCTGNCDTTTGTCTRVSGACLMADEACAAGPDCCSFSCIDFVCNGNQCTSDGEACNVNGECCGGICDNGTCSALNPLCKTSGNTCGGNAECCSGSCTNGLCDNAVSFCVQTGDACTTDVECCGGLCNIAQGAPLGTCIDTPTAGGVPGCAVAGQLCEAGANYAGGPLDICGGECCSRACFPYGPSGALVCQPPSGCKPTGELCTDDSECCGGPGQVDGDTVRTSCSKAPGATVGRCDNGHVCSPAGGICRLQTNQCNATDTCCAGNVQQDDTCHKDNLGIPRCGQPGGSACISAGGQCATSADCCNLAPCTPDPTSETGQLICGSGCINTGGACTTSADCCSGLPCNAGVCGASQGCADYGQTCTTTTDCCNADLGITCQNGFCLGMLQ